jgi:hypothetical protein
MDEVEDIVLRNTQELKGELESVFQAAQQELTEELQELLRMAYERRRQLHLAALSAGRVHASPTYGMHGGEGVVPLEEGNEGALRPQAFARGEAGGAAVEAAAAAAAAAELQSAMRRSARLGGAALSARVDGDGSGAPDPYGAKGEARRGGAL